MKSRVCFGSEEPVDYVYHINCEICEKEFYLPLTKGPRSICYECANILKNILMEKGDKEHVGNEKD